MSTIIPKPWGKELIFTPPTSPYTGKILYLNAQTRLSLQAHDTKTETLVLFFGQVDLVSGPDQDHLSTQPMNLLEGYTISPHTIHRLQAIKDSVVFEVSTPETGTTQRLEDDYHRPDETPSLRDLPNRGWNPHSL